VENVAELIWGALLIVYLLGAGRPEYRTWPVAAVFSLSAGAACLELLLRRRGWRWVLVYDCVVWTVLLSAMVAVTGGRGSEAWPAYVLMSLTAPTLGHPLRHYGLMGLNSALYALLYAWWNPQGAPFVPALLLLRIGLFFLIAYVVDRALSGERAALAARVGELVSARDAERRRIAADIHDWLGSGLVAPMRRLELALRSPEQQGARVNEALDQLRRSHDELRRIMEQLHPHLLEQMGVVEALRTYVLEWGEAHGVTAAFMGDPIPEPPAEVALAAFRILQESLNNTAKHAGAARVQVALDFRNDRLCLTVQDDGRGFPPPAPGAAGRGLTGMRERAEACGGRLTVAARPGQGTRVTALLPIHK
jgi:signal transduction histidine kinase